MTDTGAGPTGFQPTPRVVRRPALAHLSDILRENPTNPPALRVMAELPLDILVVDDQPDVVEVIRGGLQQAGHTVHSAMSGEEGLARASTESFDAIVLDVMLL